MSAAPPYFLPKFTFASYAAVREGRSPSSVYTGAPSYVSLIDSVTWPEERGDECELAARSNTL